MLHDAWVQVPSSDAPRYAQEPDVVSAIQEILGSDVPRSMITYYVRGKNVMAELRCYSSPADQHRIIAHACQGMRATMERAVATRASGRCDALPDITMDTLANKEVEVDFPVSTTHGPPTRSTRDVQEALLLQDMQ